MLRRFGWLAGVGALGVLVACAQAPVRSATTTTAASPDVNALYAQLDQASAQYDQALQQARQGDTTQAQTTLAAAMDAMRNASDACVNTSGCDTQRFLSAYDRALRLKDGSFLGTEDDEQAPDDALADASESGVLATLPQAQRTVQLLHDHTLSDLVAGNSTVQAALQVWLTRMRPNLIRAYVDYQYLRAEMWPAFHKAGLPEAILFGLVAKESGGSVHAVSRSGAAGPLQFMPATGSRFGLNTVDGFDQRFDPALAAQAGAAYLNEQLGKLNDNLALVLAAYNGGEGRIGRLAATATDANFWTPDVYYTLAPETREYVPMVLAAAWLFMHPHRYNLHFPKIDGAPGSIDLVNAASLNELSVCFGDDDGARYGWYRTLRNLNPQLDPTQVQAQGTRISVPKFLQVAYRQTCTTGEWVALATKLQEAQAPAPPAQLAAQSSSKKSTSGSAGHYTVRRGDTLSAIARRFQCGDVRRLVRGNHLNSAADLQIGERLRLEGCKRR